MCSYIALFPSRSMHCTKERNTQVEYGKGLEWQRQKKKKKKLEARTTHSTFWLPSQSDQTAAGGKRYIFWMAAILWQPMSRCRKIKGTKLDSGWWSNGKSKSVMATSSQRPVSSTTSRNMGGTVCVYIIDSPRANTVRADRSFPRGWTFNARMSTVLWLWASLLLWLRNAKLK